MHGKKIAAVLWPDTETEKGRCLMAGYSCDDLYLEVAKNGESWILQIKDGAEVARHNLRYVETVEWVIPRAPAPGNHAA